MKIVVDGVSFQLDIVEVCNFWRSLLAEVVKRPGLEIVFLDRGNAPDVAGLKKIPFPTYTKKYNSADSNLLEHICQLFSADLFLSTRFTTPLRTPTLAFVDDMLPEGSRSSQDDRNVLEQELHISHARRHICLSEQIKLNLIGFCPELNPDEIAVARAGLETEIFSPRTGAEQDVLLAKLGLSRPYFIFADKCLDSNCFDDAAAFFLAASYRDHGRFDILCTKCEPGTEPQLEDLAMGCSITRSDLSDDEMAIAYSGAEALVCRSLYDSGGMPVIEAMACGCPVITIERDALAEPIDSAWSIGGLSPDDVARVLKDVRESGVRERLKESGYRQAANWSWANFVDVLEEEAQKVVTSARKGDFDNFYHYWSELRKIQGDVDIKL